LIIRENQIFRETTMNIYRRNDKKIKKQSEM